MAEAIPDEIALDEEPRAPSAREGWRLRRVDFAIAVGLMALGASLRGAWWSGFGLGDDLQWLGFLRQVDAGGLVPADNSAYRFTWWLPTLLACRRLGFTEAALILPVFVVDALGIGLVYLFGAVLAGRAGGVIAALLLIVHPLDFAWSTMLTNDLFVSFFSALALLCTLLALEEGDEARKGWLWSGAAVSLWLGVHAKLNALLLAPVIAFACWRRRDRLDADVLLFAIVAALLFGGSMMASHRLFGDAIAPYHAELAAQGLTDVTSAAEAIKFHRLTAPVFWTWPRTLLWPNHLGNWLFSVYPHLLLLLLLLAPALGLTVPVELLAWLLIVFVGMQFNSLRQVEGVWVAGFRNVRHAHALAYPIVLLLGVLLARLRSRWRRGFNAAMAVLLGFGLWQSISTAAKTRTAFADRRAAWDLLASRTAKPVFSDFQLRAGAILLGLPHPFHALDMDRERRRTEIADVRAGYCVTGGAREPIYGCVECIPAADELPLGRWRLLLEVQGPPPSSWRPEPLRVWEAVEAAEGVSRAPATVARPR